MISLRRWGVPLLGIGLIIFLLWRLNTFGFSASDPLSGRVLDVHTKAPLEGVYVMAVYKQGGSSLGHNSSECVQTKGMYTRKDGRFSLPRVSDVSVDIVGIKPGYTPHTLERFSHSVLFGSRLLPDLFLGKRAHDVRQHPQEFVMCIHGLSAADVAANIEYLKIMDGEKMKYEGASVAGDAMRSLQRRFSSTPPVNHRPSQK